LDTDHATERGVGIALGFRGFGSGARSDLGVVADLIHSEASDVQATLIRHLLENAEGMRRVHREPMEASAHRPEGDSPLETILTAHESVDEIVASAGTDTDHEKPCLVRSSSCVVQPGAFSNAYGYDRHRSEQNHRKSRAKLGHSKPSLMTV
jgi:hypothetical protein